MLVKSAVRNFDLKLRQVLHKQLNDLRIEMRARAFAQQRDCVRRASFRAERPVFADRVETIDDDMMPRSDRNLFAFQPSG
jgi:hypothetical protein